MSGLTRHRGLGAVAVLAVLLAACGDSGTSAQTDAGGDTSSSAADADRAGTRDTNDDDAPDQSQTEVRGTDGTGRCPAGVTADTLGQPSVVGSADVDGDGRPDEVSLGTVPGGGQACGTAVLVTTAEGTFAAPVQLAVVDSPLGTPVFAQLDGAAGQEIVVTTSWSPRGGGELGMFSWVDGRLVQVQQAGKPWSLFATIDDGGGTPRLLSCTNGGFVDVAAYPPGADTGSSVTAYVLRAGVVRPQERTTTTTATYAQVKSDYPALPRSGLEVFPDCG